MTITNNFAARQALSAGIVRVCRPCQRCGLSEATLELRRYPLNRAAAWFCISCEGLNRSRGRLFIPHSEIRAGGIDPDRLPLVLSCGTATP